jgi:hypothetical protein
MKNIEKVLSYHVVVGLMILWAISYLKYRSKRIWLMSYLDIAVSKKKSFLANMFLEYRPEELYGWQSY